MLIKFITFVFWFLIMSSLMTYSFELINEPNTIANWIAHKIADVFPHLNFQYERKKQMNTNKLEIIKTSDSNIEQPAQITH